MRVRGVPSSTGEGPPTKLEALRVSDEGTNDKSNNSKDRDVQAPIIMSGVDGTQPPGVYDVDTDEESLESLSILGYRRVGHIIQVHRDGTTQVFQIDPREWRRL